MFYCCLESQYNYVFFNLPMLIHNNEIIFTVHVNVVVHLQYHYIPRFLISICGLVPYSSTIAFFLTLVFSQQTNKFHMWVCKNFFSIKHRNVLLDKKERGTHCCTFYSAFDKAASVVPRAASQASLPNTLIQPLVGVKRYFAHV